MRFLLIFQGGLLWTIGAVLLSWGPEDLGSAKMWGATFVALLIGAICISYATSAAFARPRDERRSAPPPESGVER